MKRPDPPNHSPLLRATRAAAYEAVDGVLFSDKSPAGLRRKYDIQLTRGLLAERKLGLIFRYGIFATNHDVLLELKTESYQWEKTGNIAVEYMMDGRPSGISTTIADVWVHEVRRGEETLVWHMFPIARLKTLARAAIEEGRRDLRAGDRRRFAVALISLRDIHS